MALDPNNRLIDVTGTFINQQIQKQTWYQANSNTITAAGGLVATLIVWASSQAFAQDPRVQTGLLIAGFLLTVLGVNRTPNGWSRSQVAKIHAAQADAITSKETCTGDCERPSEGLEAEPEEEQQEAQARLATMLKAYEEHLNAPKSAGL